MILISGANGYIGRRLIAALAESGQPMLGCVRSLAQPERLLELGRGHLQLLQVDFLAQDFNFDPQQLQLLKQVKVAYYLLHSMRDDASNFGELEARTARNFLRVLEFSGCEQIIYLGGIANSTQLSRHMASRHQVATILGSDKYALTYLRAGIIVGSGSASFEIIRDLVEKLPVMVAPRWLNTPIQPIAIRNVLEFLVGVAGKPQYYNCEFDIASPRQMTYKSMLLEYARQRGLKRRILTLPVLSARLSSYWLYFVTSTSFKLARSLVESMLEPVLARPNRLAEQLGIELLDYERALQLAFSKIEQNAVVSSWKDAFSASGFSVKSMQRVEVPKYGCYKDVKKLRISAAERERVVANIFAIGGKRGWYYMNWAWAVRGVADKLVGGVGLRRGRTSDVEVHAGDSLDFWRVLISDEQQGRLLLYAEMKLPGEAWLEWRILPVREGFMVLQIATFRPLGLWGRLYWWSMWPMHLFIFSGMLRNIFRYRHVE